MADCQVNLLVGHFRNSLKIKVYLDIVCSFIKRELEKDN